MESPAVDIIVPVYNTERYLRECLESVLGQETKAPFRVICVNDGSTDDSLNILQEFSERDHRIEILSQPNGGLSAARNTGLNSVVAPFVTFVDSDDVIPPDAIESLYQTIASNQADITIGHIYDYDSRQPGDWFNYDQWSLSPKTSPQDKLDVLDYCFACSKMFRTGFLREQDLRFPEGVCFEDNLFSIQALVLAKKIVVHPHVVYYYRQRPDSIVRSTSKRSYMDIIDVLRDAKDFLKAHQVWSEFRDAFLKYKLKVCYHHYEHINSTYRRECADRIAADFDADERRFVSEQSCGLSNAARHFYSTLDQANSIGRECSGSGDGRAARCIGFIKGRFHAMKRYFKGKIGWREDR